MAKKVTEKTTHLKAFYEVESITLDSNEGKLTVGNSHTIKATIAPEEVAAETPIEWSSSNEKVATVDSNGKVRLRPLLQALPQSLQQVIATLMQVQRMQ